MTPDRWADLFNTRIRKRIVAQNPSTPANRLRLAPYSTLDQAQTSYQTAIRDLTTIAEILRNERADAATTVGTYLNQVSRTSGG